MNKPGLLLPQMILTFESKGAAANASIIAINHAGAETHFSSSGSANARNLEFASHTIRLYDKLMVISVTGSLLVSAEACAAEPPFSSTRVLADDLPSQKKTPLLHFFVHFFAFNL